MKIRNRILLGYLMAFGMAGILGALIAGWSMEKFMSQRAHENVANISTQTATYLRSYLDSKISLAKVESNGSLFVDLLTGEATASEYQMAKKWMETVMLTDDDVSELWLLNNAGKMMVATNPSLESLYLTSDPNFVNGKKGLWVGDVIRDELTGKIFWTIAFPVVDQNQVNTLGVLVTKLKIEPLESFLRSQGGLGETGESFLVTSDKKLLSKSLFLDSDSVLKTVIDTENVRRCFDESEIEKVESGADYDDVLAADGKDSTRTYVDYRGVSVLGTHAYIPQTKWCLVTKLNQAEVWDPIVKTRLVILAIVGMGFLSFGVAGVILSKKITKPIEELQAAVDVVKAGNFDQKVGTASPDEVGKLSRSFDEMVQSVKKYRQEASSKLDEQTKEITSKNLKMSEQQKALLNVLEDVENEKWRVAGEKEKMDAILGSIGDAVFVVNNDLTLGLINQVALSLSMWKGEAAIGINYRQVLKFVSKDNPQAENDQFNDEFIEKVLKSGEQAEMSADTLLLRPDGSTIPVADSAAPLRDKEGRVVGCVVVFRDVTKAKEIDRMKDEFLSVASHELRTPMTAVKGYLSMLLEGDYGEVHKEWVEPIQTVMHSTERLINLVNDLLSVSRMQAGRIKFAMSDFGIAEVVEQEIAELKTIATDKGLTLEAHDLPRVSVYADQDKIRQIINNLVGNAMKFTEKGGIVISGTTEGDLFKLFVKDSGMGMAPDFQNKLFGRFVQESTSVKGRPAGTGLGLYISQQLSRQMGGDVWLVDSKDGEGSTFGFSIPISGTGLADQVANKLRRLLQV